MESGASFCGIAKAADLGEAFNRFIDILRNSASGATGVGGYADDPANPPGLSYLGMESWKRRNIKNWFSPAESVLICGFQYWNAQCETELRSPVDFAEFFRRTGRKFIHPELVEYFRTAEIIPEISRYALSFDYHKTIRKILKTILCRIKKILPEVEGKIFVDTSPVMEKEFARLSGLGWQGKNTLILSKGRGSWFFTGGIALPVKLEPGSTVENLCGRCDVCIRACPAKALKNPGALDAGLCISYWNTQHKEKLDRKIAGTLDCWLYGCDVCQQVCPYNKEVKTEILKDFLPVIFW
ncbi:MAG: DUF1730 domain-containing protein [Elusimicrobia bacterium]|nr:DUF1730 domain-containing protein [Elusimicrobiota bacterium]